MFANYQEIKKRVRHIEGELKQIEEMEKNWPAGELICTRNSGRYKWYLKNRKQSIYLPKRERKLSAEKVSPVTQDRSEKRIISLSEIYSYGGNQ